MGKNLALSHRIECGKVRGIRFVSWHMYIYFALEIITVFLALSLIYAMRFQDLIFFILGVGQIYRVIGPSLLGNRNYF